MRINGFFDRRRTAHPEHRGAGEGRWRWVMATALLPTAAGCAVTPQPMRPPAAPPAPSEAVRLHAHDDFEVAAFYKPQQDSWSGPEAELAPLIMRELSRTRAGRDGHGTTSLGGGWAPIHEDGHRVFVDTRVATDGETEYQQFVYAWHDSGATLSLRITVGGDGFPLTYVVETSKSESPDRHDSLTIFVSRSLEDRAVAAFGEPLDGRRFAIERSRRETPGVVVAGVVEDGPIPMGPYVYVSAVDHRITTLLCRCSPSQVERIAETDYYVLRPMSETTAEDGWDLTELRAPPNGGPARFVEKQLLRWPDE